MPALPLKNTILFPGLLLPLSVGRDNSLKAVQAALNTEAKEIILIAQRDAQVETPAAGRSLYDRHKGSDSEVVAGGDGMMEILVLGVERVVVDEGRSTKSRT